MKRYLRTRWKELAFALAATLAGALMIYTLILQGSLGGFTDSLKRKEPKTTKPSPLTGVEVPIALADRGVTALMIENSPDARPQSGLSDAGVVFEAVAEGGITRYVVFYQEARPQVIGPVRSLRPYYLDWAQGYDAPIAHVGGSADALNLVRARNAKDLDQYNYGSSFWRSGDRVAPHNVYTSFDRLDALNQKLGYTTSNFTPYKRKKDTPSATPTHTAVTVDYSGPNFTAQFRYEQANNWYLRFNAGSPDVDRESNRQIAVKNVVVLIMPTGYDGKYATMPSVGHGTGILFRDGGAIPINWHKGSPGAQLELKDQANNPVELNVGPTWFAVAPQGRAVTY